MFEKGFSNYYVATSLPLTTLTKYLIRTQGDQQFHCEVASIIESHNKKVIKTSIENILRYKGRKKHECPLDGKCRAENIV